MLALEPDEVIDALGELSRQGALRFRMQGDVVELTLGGPTVMQTGFNALRTLLEEPLQANGGVKTDNSILLVYPPARELDFQEQLVDTFLPQLDAQGHPYRLLDLSGFLFADFDADTIRDLCPKTSSKRLGRWMRQGARVAQSLTARVAELARRYNDPRGAPSSYKSRRWPFIRWSTLRGSSAGDARPRLSHRVGVPGARSDGLLKLHFMRV